MKRKERQESVEYNAKPVKRIKRNQWIELIPIEIWKQIFELSMFDAIFQTSNALPILRTMSHVSSYFRNLIFCNDSLFELESISSNGLPLLLHPHSIYYQNNTFLHYFKHKFKYFIFVNSFPLPWVQSLLDWSTIQRITIISMTPIKNLDQLLSNCTQCKALQVNLLIKQPLPTMPLQHLNVSNWSSKQVMDTFTVNSLYSIQLDSLLLEDAMVLFNEAKELATIRIRDVTNSTVMKKLKMVVTSIKCIEMEHTVWDHCSLFMEYFSFPNLNQLKIHFDTIENQQVFTVSNEYPQLRFLSVSISHKSALMVGLMNCNHLHQVYLSNCSLSLNQQQTIPILKWDSPTQSSPFQTIVSNVSFYHLTLTNLSYFPCPHLKLYCGKKCKSISVSNVTDLRSIEIVKSGNWMQSICVEKCSKLATIKWNEECKKVYQVEVKDCANWFPFEKWNNRVIWYQLHLQNLLPNNNYQTILFSNGNLWKQLRILQLKTVQEWNETNSKQLFSILKDMDSFKQLQLECSIVCSTLFHRIELIQHKMKECHLQIHCINKSRQYPLPFTTTATLDASNLRELNIEVRFASAIYIKCDKLKSIKVSENVHLNALHVNESQHLKEINLCQILEAKKDLQHFYQRHSWLWKSLELVTLDLKIVDHLIMQNFLSLLQNVKRIYLSKLHGMTSMKLHHLKQLTHVVIHDCQVLNELELNGGEDLVVLDLGGCTSLHKILFVEKDFMLRRINICNTAITEVNFKKMIEPHFQVGYTILNIDRCKGLGRDTKKKFL